MFYLDNKLKYYTQVYIKLVIIIVIVLYYIIICI